MTQVVTSYFIDAQAEGLSSPEEWLAKVKDLGLEGQEELLGESNSPVPFARMTAEMQRIVETICPEKVVIKKFKKEAIPMKVLELVGLSVYEDYFETIEVHFSPTEPDPFVIGITSEKGMFLIARWGEEEMSFSELRMLAIEKWKRWAKARLEEKTVEVRQQLETLDALAEKQMSGGYVPIY